VFTILLGKARCEVSKKFENPLSDTRSHLLFVRAIPRVGGLVVTELWRNEWKESGFILGLELVE